MVACKQETNEVQYHKSQSIRTFLKVLYNVSFTSKEFATRAITKMFDVPADDISYTLLYRNALDIHCKHTASHLHDEVNVS